jgi:hypothetical protein
MMTLIKDSIRVTILSFIVSISAYFAFAQTSLWSEPTASPPGGNVLIPLHGGMQAQTKSGALTLTDLTLSGSLYSDTARSAFFGGLYQTYDSPTGGCETPNPVTGSCSCPSGFNDVSFITNYPTGYCGWYAGYTYVDCADRRAYIHQCWK